MKRRDFIKSVSVAAVNTAILTHTPASLNGKEKSSTQNLLIIDAMGEIRLTHERNLIKEVIESGTNSVTVTLCDPKFQEQEAYDIAMEELIAYDRHIQKNSDLFVKATTIADVDKAKTSGRLALFYYYQNTTHYGQQCYMG